MNRARRLLEDPDHAYYQDEILSYDDPDDKALPVGVFELEDGKLIFVAAQDGGTHIRLTYNIANGHDESLIWSPQPTLDERDEIDGTAKRWAGRKAYSYAGRIWFADDGATLVSWWSPKVPDNITLDLVKSLFSDWFNPAVSPIKVQLLGDADDEWRELAPNPERTKSEIANEVTDADRELVARLASKEHTLDPVTKQTLRGAGLLRSPTKAPRGRELLNVVGDSFGYNSIVSSLRNAQTVARILLEGRSEWSPKDAEALRDEWDELDADYVTPAQVEEIEELFGQVDEASDAEVADLNYFIRSMFIYDLHHKAKEILVAHGIPADSKMGYTTAFDKLKEKISAGQASENEKAAYKEVLRLVKPEAEKHREKQLRNASVGDPRRARLRAALLNTIEARIGEIKTAIARREAKTQQELADQARANFDKVRAARISRPKLP